MCVFFPLNRSLKRLSVWFQGKNLPTKNRWLERSKPEFNSSFACRFLHYGWSRHGIHTWHGTNKQKCTSQWEFSYSLIFPSPKKKSGLAKTMKNSCLSFSTTRPLVPWNISKCSSRMQLGQAVPESIVLKELLSPLCAVQAKFYLNCAADICGKKNVKHYWSPYIKEMNTIKTSVNTAFVLFIFECWLFGKIYKQNQLCI